MASKRCKALRMTFLNDSLPQILRASSCFLFLEVAESFIRVLKCDTLVDYMSTLYKNPVPVKSIGYQSSDPVAFSSKVDSAYGRVVKTISS